MSQVRLDEFNDLCLVEDPAETYGAITSYRDLIVWQRSMEVTVKVYELTALLPSDERFGLVSQMRRASTSMPSNIAEGWGRGTSSDQQFLSYLRISRGSLYELETQIELSKRLFHKQQLHTAPLTTELTIIAKMLSKLIVKIEARYQQLRKDRGQRQVSATHRSPQSEILGNHALESTSVGDRTAQSPITSH